MVMCMTKLEVLTLPYDPVALSVDQAPLLELQQRAEVIAQQSYLVGPPHALVLLLTTRPHQQSRPTSRHSVTYVPHAIQATQATQSSKTLKKRKSRQDRAEELEAVVSALSEREQSAFEHLRAWRNAEAMRVGVPPFEVCSNQALAEMVNRKPNTLTALRAIEGLGEKRVKRFGEALLAQLQAHLLIPSPVEEQP